MIQLLGVVGSLAQTFLEGKVEKEKAKSEIMKTAAQHDSKWELIMAESTKGSWKDEIITVAVLTPCIMSFIPGAEDLVKEGFARLNELPDWYQNILYVTILAGLGLKGLDKFRGSNGHRASKERLRTRRRCKV